MTEFQSGTARLVAKVFRYVRSVGWTAITVSAMGWVPGAEAAPANLAAIREVVQEGLAIGLANTVMQSQLYYMIFSGDGSAVGCQSFAQFAPGNFAAGSGSYAYNNGQLVLYYDDACARRYMKLTPTPSGGTVTQYTGVDGVTPLATLTSNSTLVGNSIAGIGNFTAADGSKATLGLYVDLTAALNGNLGAQFPVTGLVQQDFADLGVALGSATTLTLALATPMPFSGSGTGFTAAMQGLGISTKAGNALQITGGVANATPVVSGQAGSFSLLPAMPTTWTSSMGGLTFSIAVLDNTTRNLSGTVTQQSSGAVLATLALDQSGTGVITYAGGTTGSITGWVQSTQVNQNCLFNWAERNYASLLSPAGSVTSTYPPYIYRYYARTNTYAGISSLDNHVYYMGPSTANVATDLGAAPGWYATAGCQ